MIGGGMACCGAAYEMMRWAEAVKAETGTELRIKLVEQLAEEIYQPVRTFLEHKDYTTVIDINPHYITPKMLQMRLQKIMDEYVAGTSTYYNTNEKMLRRGRREAGDAQGGP
nr:hypothetical protein [Rhodoferax sp.]